MSGGRITYDDAIASLRSMFPTVNQATLAKVLQANRGAMEPAIEQLLAMEVPDTTPQPPAEPIRRPDQHPQLHQQRSQSSQPRWRNPLPDDFLRIPGVGLPHLPDTPRPAAASNAAGSISGGGGSQVERDAALAAMIQNELFLEQLRTDPEFAAYLAADPAAAEALGLTHLVRSVRRPAAGQVYYHPHPGGGAPAVGGGFYHSPGDPYAAQQQQLAAQQARAAAIQRQLQSHDGGDAPRSQAPSSSSRNVTGISGGSRPAPPTLSGVDAADGAVQTTGGSWMDAMRRRIDTLSARFRRQQAVGGSTAAPRAPAAATGSSWFGRGRGGSGYAAVSTTGAGDGGISSGHTGPAGGGDGDDDDGHLLGGGGSHVDHGRLGDGGGVEIELSEAAGGGGRVAAGSHTAPHGLGGAGYGSLNGDGGSSAPATAFVIDDEEDDDDSRLVTGGGGRPRQQHV